MTYQEYMKMTKEIAKMALIHPEDLKRLNSPILLR